MPDTAISLAPESEESLLQQKELLRLHISESYEILSLGSVTYSPKQDRDDASYNVTFEGINRKSGEKMTGNARHYEHAYSVYAQGVEPLPGLVSKLLDKARSFILQGTEAEKLRQEKGVFTRYLRKDFDAVALGPITRHKKQKNDRETIPENFSADFTAVSWKDQTPVKGTIEHTPSGGLTQVQYGSYKPEMK